jgi:hypothetical protein
MNTIIIDSETGEVRSVLSGPISLHTKTISEISGHVAIEYNGTSTNKKGQLIDGTWQLVDDIDKILSFNKREKILSINMVKKNNLEFGISVTGEQLVAGSWVPGQVKIGFTGKDLDKMLKVVRKFSVLSQVDPTQRDQKLLKGRSAFKINFVSRRLLFFSYDELKLFIETWQDYIDTADIIEEEMIEAVSEAQTIEEVQAVDEISGWGELNG